MATQARANSEANRSAVVSRRPVDSSALPPFPKPQMRRAITREHGRALEMIGHAADYLTDCYLNEGEDEEIVNTGGPFADALYILISAHSELLWSLPVVEPLTQRILNAVFHRKPDLASHPVIPLSSSR